VERLFKLALKQFVPKPGPPQVSIAHIHQSRVSVREHAQLLRDRLRRAGSATFTLLVADCENTLEVVARFLALLELYREGLIEFEQPVSLDELTVRWVGGEAADGELDIDDYEGSPPDPDETPPPDEAADEEELSELLAARDDLADDEADDPLDEASRAFADEPVDEALGALADEPLDEASGEAFSGVDEQVADGFGDGDSGAGGAGTFRAIVSDSGEDRAGRFDTPEARLDLGGGDDDAAPAAVEERS
jgi:segregation and condensation protein A